MKKPLALLPALLAAAACATDPRDIGREPHMTPVGSGLTFYDTELPMGPARNGALGPGMQMQDTKVNLFRDLRAMSVGDVVTVYMVLDEKAALGNQTDRSRDSKVKTDWSFLFNFIPIAPVGPNHSWSGKITDNLQNDSAMQGHGQTNRSEQIRLAVAAVVTAVLPNGNLVIQGSQEIRVNFELRVLNIGGVVRPLDLSKDNSIPYEKVAEARISYGGRGRLMEVQQPAIGQQLYDTFTPF